MKKKKNQRKRKINKEEEAEDWCFLCKDGGQLIICDHGDCLKVYHPECVGKDEAFAEAGESWTCDWHSCLMCRKNAKFHCFCCPNAFCGSCISSADFGAIKGDGGFCEDCLELILLGEENEAYDSNGDTINFSDRDTHEGLFKEYWEIIKEKEGLTMDDVYAVNTKLKKNERHHRRGSVSFKLSKKEEDDEFIIASDSDKEDNTFQPLGKRNKSKKQEFIGWGSKPLIEFLKSIGKYTTEQLNHYEVDSIIKEYIRERKLLDPEKKHKVICDEKLYSIFRKKSLMKSKILYLLESHFVESSDDSEDENEYKICLRNKDENTVAAPTCKKQRTLSLDENTPEKEVCEVFKESGFASIVAENIKLIYLRKSVVEDLLKQPESFEGKVIGSYVRVKTDRRDYLQRRSSYQLLPVTGIEKTLTGEILLQIPYMLESLRVHLLSDVDFNEEECLDLQEKIESGVLKKPAIVSSIEQVDISYNLLFFISNLKQIVSF
ncbi:hypothetical protein UlMin_021798 [Ulmus minor]